MGSRLPPPVPARCHTTGTRPGESRSKTRSARCARPGRGGEGDVVGACEVRGRIGPRGRTGCIPLPPIAAPCMGGDATRRHRWGRDRPYKQGVDGSSPSAPTSKSLEGLSFSIALHGRPGAEPILDSQVTATRARARPSPDREHGPDGLLRPYPWATPWKAAPCPPRPASLAPSRRGLCTSSPPPSGRAQRAERVFERDSPLFVPFSWQCGGSGGDRRDPHPWAPQRTSRFH